ncbi:MAG: MBL fold metallo-hydrolase [Ruminococcaceae bacterium]|nr:MBL fold metallo-hydrolase [Oscillospiraceae bacterium]
MKLMQSKKNMLRRWGALALAGWMALSCLTSCKADPPAAGETTTEAPSDSSTQEGLGDSVLSLAENGTANYRIVYPMIAGIYLGESMQTLKSELQALSGAAFTAVSDALAKDDKDGHTEILLGVTSFAESEAAAGQLAENAYSITVSEGRIVIVASNEGLYPTAVAELLSALSVSDGRLTLKRDYTRISGSHVAAKLVENGESRYRIVYQRKSEEMKALALELQEMIRKTTGVTIPTVGDSEASMDNYEILLGDTNRKFSIASEMHFKNYGVLFQKERRTIALTGDLHAAMALFQKMLSAMGKKGSLELPEPIFGRFTAEGCGDIPAFRDSLYDTLVDGDYGSYHVLYSKATAEEYEAYVKRLTEAEGYTLRDARTVNGNRFATLVNEETVLTVSYIAFRASVRISCELLSTVSLAPVTQQAFERVTTPQLTQINGNCSFILRLSDGRFLVVDGGLNRTENVDGLYEQLVAQNVLGEKPVIAAWILSHAHSDHYGGFIGFADKYASKVTVENVVLSPPSYTVYSQNGEASDTTPTMKSLITKAKDVIRVKYSKAGVIIPHAGQILWFADAMVDMLYTYEDLTPSPMKVTNSSSLVYTVTIAGQRICFLNDAHDDTSEIIYKTYGDTLKLDIVQIAHHGYNGGHKGMYQKMNAATALWTSPYETVVSGGLWNNPRNNFDINSVQENLMMPNHHAMVIPLPHAVGALPTYSRTFS